MKALGIVFSNIHDTNLPELVRMRTLASIPFGGRYRLLDFALSNMVNSGIDKVGVITKRNYRSLMDHVGSGKDWDLARKDGGLIILPPFGDRDSDGLYNSRLEALKSITGFLQHTDEDYVVMTDCDNVCRIDYNKVIEFHRINKADITLVYRKSSSEEDNAVTVTVTPEGRITNLKYESKIDGEQNVFANIYVMKRSLLRNLIMDSLASNYTHFTTDLLVTNLKAMRVMGFEHKGYFAAITSLQSYYERNMDLLDEKHRHELFGDRSVFTKIRDSVPTKYGACAVVKNSLIADGCLIEGTVENSVIFRGVKVARGSVVKNCILMQNTVLGENVTMNCMITDKDVVVRDMRVLSGSENHPFYVPKGTMI